MNIEQEVINAVISVIILVISARFFGIICKKFRFPEVIGYVVAGIVFGPYALGGELKLFGGPLMDLDGLLNAFSQIAAIIILFAAGLHFTFNDLKQVGLKASLVSATEFFISIFVAYYVAVSFGLDWTVAIIIAAAFGATSIAISTTILEELGKEQKKEAKLLVNVAILDDIFGLAVLSAAVGLALDQSVINLGSIVYDAIESIGFWVLLVIGAVFFLPKIMILVKHKGTRHTTDVTVIGSAFGFASIAELLGLNPILGAFAAGMGLASSHIEKHVREYIETLKYVAAPLFFSIIGAHVNLGDFWNLSPLLFIILLVVAISTKIFGAGLPSSFLFKSKKKGFAVGFGMVARSEVAFIALSVGITSGIIDDMIYSILTFIILSTIFISSVLMRNIYSKKD